MAAEGMIIDFGASDSTDFSGTKTSPIKGSYTDFFWGTECRGFEVLMANLKAHVTASHQMGEYLKERVLLERTYVKSLRKLSKNLNSTVDANLGGFYPVWLVLLRTLDQACINKDRQVNALNDLSKTILEYSSKQDEQMKGNMKGDIDSAHKSLSTYRSSLHSVKKSHRAYDHSCRELVLHEIEAEKLKVDPLKEHEAKKAEHKVKKLRTQMEHMKAEHQKEIDSCNEKLNDYEDKMSKACSKFQSLEESHLESMRGFLAKLAEVHQSCDISVYKEYKQLSEKQDAFPVDKLISMFAQIKGTGKTKPEPVKFVAIVGDAIRLSRKGSLGGQDDISTTSTSEEATKPKEETTKPKGARRGLFAKDKKRKKKREKNGVTKDKPASDANPTVVTPTNSEKEESYEVDEEGYRIRPKDADKIAKFSDDESSNDDSDFDYSDSDNEPEKHFKNIKIKAKEDSASVDAISVDELSQAAKTLKLDALPSLTGLKASKKFGSSQSLNTSSQISKPDINADTRSLHDALDNQISEPSPADSLSPLPPLEPNYDISLPPLNPTSTSLPIPDISSVLSWDIPSTTSNTADTTSTPRPSNNWATFSSDFSSNFSTPELSKKEIETAPQDTLPQQPNKSIDIGVLSNSTNDHGKVESPKLNKTAPVSAPTLAPPPPVSSAPTLAPPLSNPTGSLLLPPPSKSTSSGPRRRGTGSDLPPLNPAASSTSSLDHSSMSRVSSTSSIGSVTPISPLTTSSQKVRRDTSPVMSGNKTTPPTAAKGGVMIPFAIAFQEHCHAIYKGTDISEAVIKVTGQLDFSFPASCISQLESHEPLRFHLMNVGKVTKILHNENILKKEDENNYSFVMDKLCGQLKELEKAKGSPFCNVQGLRYEVICSESSFPFSASVAWKCDQTTTHVKLDYSYNPSVFPTATKPTLTNGTVKVTIEGGVTQHSLEPLGVWQAEKKLAGWKMGPLIPGTDTETGSLVGKFTISSGPSTPSPAIIQFLCDGSTLSGISLACLTPSAYKVSLVKNKCLAGKFIAEPSKK